MTRAVERHMMITMAHKHIVERFLADLKASAEHVRANPQLSKEGMAAMYGMMATVPDKGMVNQFVLQFLDNLYKPGPRGISR